MPAAKKEEKKEPEYVPDGRDVQLADEVARAEKDVELAKAAAAHYRKLREDKGELTA